MKKVNARYLIEVLDQKTNIHNDPEISIEKITDELPQIVFTNVIIEDTISLPTSRYYNCNLKFIDSEIGHFHLRWFDKITFENSRIESLYISGGEGIKSILVTKKSELKILMLENMAKVEYLSVTSFAQIDFVSISSKSAIQKLEIIDSGILKKCMMGQSSIESIECGYDGQLIGIHCSNYSNIKSIINSNWGYIKQVSLIKNSSINELITWENSFLNYFSIEENSSVGNICFYEKSIIGDLKINGNVERILIKSMIARLLIYNINVEDSIKIYNSKIENIYIEKNNLGRIKLYIENSHIAHFDIINTFINSGDLVHISNSNLHCLKINNLHNYGNVSFSGIEELHKWNLFLRDKEFKVVLHDNKEEFITFEIDKTFKYFENSTSCISILNSDLGATLWINCNFSTFDEIIFTSSKILECFFANTNFPIETKFATPQKQEIDSKENQKRLFYGQLKSIYSKQGDLPRASEAQAIELESYRSQLISNQPLKWRWYNFLFIWPKWLYLVFKNKEFANNFKDRFVLYLNLITSNYGNNWLKSGFVTLIVLFFTFSIYCLLIGYRPGSNSYKFFELSSYSFQYLNPFRDEDSGDFFKLINADFASQNGDLPFKIPPIARFWDYFSRIIISFMIYQTISAFRRLGKINA